MNNRTFRMQRRYSWYIVLTGLAAFILLGVVIYVNVSSMMINQSKNNAMGLAVIAANEIDGDSFETIQSERDDAYFDVLEKITKYTDYSMLQYIYTMRYKNEKLTFVVDADPKNPAACGEEYELLPEMEPALHGQACCDSKLIKDKWGSFFSAYAPIFNSEHEVVGMVGCDIRTSDIMDRLARLRNVTISLITIFAILSLISMVMIAHDMIQRDQLTEISNESRLKDVAAGLKKKNRLKDYTGMIVNIKDFKYINQQIGFYKGDEILRRYAHFLSRLITHGEYVARTGSDNFLMLVKKGREDVILNVLSPLELSIDTENGKQLLRIFSRCGIYPISEGDHLSNVTNYCTLAINSTRGKDSEDYAWYADSMSTQMVEENDILSNYKQAIHSGEFKVYYQPKVNIDDRSLCGAEALVRWIRNGRMVSPVQFIPILENEGKIIELDFYVFEQVCKDIRRWMDEGLKPVRISSNFSKLHLKNPNLSDQVLAIVKKYNISSEYIEIELTESSGYTDFFALEKFVRDMGEAGIYTSIDDFGTGYSSLSMLKDINVDVVKIDKSFFDSLGDEKQHGANLVGNVIRMIKDLDRIVICEGVETEEQVEFLKSTECNIVQGFLFDKPLPVEQFEERLKLSKY